MTRPDKTRPVRSVNGKTLIYKGRPLVAGDLKPGDEVEYEHDTGEVRSIKRWVKQCVFPIAPKPTPFLWHYLRWDETNVTWRERQDKTNGTRRDATRLDMTRPDETGHDQRDETRHDATRPDEARHDWTRHDQRDATGHD